MQPNNRFEIIIASEPDHERLVAEIYYDRKFALLVSQERAVGQFDLETPGPGLDESLIARRVPLDLLQPMIKAACEQLQLSP